MTANNFLAQFQQGQPVNSIELLRIWQHYDRNRSGYLEVDNLADLVRDLLERQNCTPTQTQVAEYVQVLLEICDMDKDGRFNLSELCKVLPLSDNLLSHCKDLQALSETDKAQIFSQYDPQDSGYIEGTALLALLRDLYQHNGTPLNVTELSQLAEQMLMLSDQDKDGKISHAELSLLLGAV